VLLFARTLRGWSPERLAAAAGVEPARILRWEAGTEPLLLGALDFLVTVMDVPLPLVPEVFDATRQLRVLVEHYAALAGRSDGDEIMAAMARAAAQTVRGMLLRSLSPEGREPQGEEPH
jgi:transcriptional regulator with XRE-family HTH domain